MIVDSNLIKQKIHFNIRKIFFKTKTQSNLLSFQFLGHRYVLVFSNKPIVSKMENPFLLSNEHDSFRLLNIRVLFDRICRQPIDEYLNIIDHLLIWTDDLSMVNNQNEDSFLWNYMKQDVIVEDLEIVLCFIRKKWNNTKYNTIRHENGFTCLNRHFCTPRTFTIDIRGFDSKFIPSWFV